nr:retrovirus-related Pol polyprotein from transposon TNT 1-94 [Tanacetum cinerariifolium]
MGQDRQMHMVGGNDGNQFRQYSGQNVGNLNRYNDGQNIRNQNLNGNGNLIAARAEGNATGHNGNQIRCYNCRGVAYHDEIEEVNANCILMANLQQASTSGTQTDKAPVYDSDGSVEVHNYENCDDNEIFNMFTQEEQYTELLEPIFEPHQVTHNNNDVDYEVSSVEQSGGTVEQHPANVEETRVLYDSLYNNLTIEVEKSTRYNDVIGNQVIQNANQIGNGNLVAAHAKGNAGGQNGNQIAEFLGTVRFGNDHVAAILGFDDLQWGNILITRVYFVEGLGHNLFSVGQFCDSDLEVAFRRNACFVRNLEGVDLLKGNRSTNLYTINLHQNGLCILNLPHGSCFFYQVINDLAKNDLVSGLPKFKYHKEHLCSSCEQGKSKRASHPPKPVPNSRQRLHLLHMDLCGPMRIASINGKRYVLVIVNDYSRYTWV